MFWTIGQFPELDHLEPEQRAQLLRQVPRRTYSALISRSVGAGFFATFPLGIWLAVMGAEEWVKTIVIGAFFILASGAVYQFQLLRIRKDMRRTIKDAFKFQRPPFCFGCGYDLRAADGWICPECGRETVAQRAKWPRCRSSIATISDPGFCDAIIVGDLPIPGSSTGRSCITSSSG